MPKQRNRSFIADLGRALDALAYADLGEYTPRREKEALLRGKPVHVTAPPASPEARPVRRVALAVQGQLRPEALRYADHACERLNADLDILTMLPGDKLERAIAPERQRLVQAGHQVEVIRLGRDIIRGILHYASTRRGLLFVVVSAEDSVHERVVGGISDSRHLDVPWVVVAGAQAV